MAAEGKKVGVAVGVSSCLFLHWLVGGHVSGMLEYVRRGVGRSGVFNFEGVIICIVIVVVVVVDIVFVFLGLFPHGLVQGFGTVVVPCAIVVVVG